MLVGFSQMTVEFFCELEDLPPCNHFSKLKDLSEWFCRGGVGGAANVEIHPREHLMGSCVSKDMSCISLYVFADVAPRARFTIRQPSLKPWA